MAAILITGAGSGIGKATALLLARQGHQTGLLGHTAQEIEAVAAEIRSNGGETLALTADTRDAGEMRSTINTLVQTFGHLSGLVASAGINGVWAPIDDLQPDEWNETLAVNLTGTYMTLHLAIPHLKANGGGSVVVVSSINGTRTFTSAGATAYSATKAGQLAMVQQLALELAKDKIRINAVCPGAIDTKIDDNTSKRNLEEIRPISNAVSERVPLNDDRPGRSEDVAQAIAFLLSPAAGHITGTPLWIDGAQILLR